MPASISSAANVFVDRVPELEQMHRAFHSVQETGKPKFVLIAGGFGEGKTALVEHFIAEVVAAMPAVLIGRGSCAMGSERNGLVPFAMLLDDLAAQSMRHGIVSGNVGEFMTQVIPAWLELLPLSGAFKAAFKTVEQTTKLVTGTTYSQGSVFVQFANALQRLTRQHSAIAFIDDIHWADHSSIQLLFHLARYLSDTRILFIGTYRPTEALESGAVAEQFRQIRANLLRYGEVEIELKRGIDVAEYVRQRYPRNDFAPQVLDRIQQATGGLALWVSQLFQTWEEAGVIVPAADLAEQVVWRMTRSPDKIPLFENLSKVLEEQLRPLSAEQRRILNSAAVEGEDFTAQIVRRACLLEELQIQDALDIFSKRYYLVEYCFTREVQIEVLDFYRFTQRFFREHIYGAMDPPRRRWLHQKIGDALEAVYGTNEPALAGQMAHHFREASQHLKAARYAVLAADYEQAHFAWAAGEHWCEFGLNLVPPNTTDLEWQRIRLNLFERSGAGYSSMGNFSQAAIQFRAALTLAKEIQADPVYIAELYRRLADSCDGEARFEEAMKLLEEGRQLLSATAAPLSETHIWLEALRAFMPIRFGQHEKAAQMLRDVIAQAKQMKPTTNLERALARLYNWLATAYSNADRYIESIEANHDAIRIARKIRDYQPEASGLQTLAETYTYLGRLDEGLQFAEEALQVAERSGDVDNIAYAYSLRGFVRLAQGDARSAIADSDHAIDLSRRLGARWNMPGMYADLARGHLMLGDLAAAYDYARRGVGYADQGTFERGYALGVLAQVEAARAEWSTAEQHFQEALEFQLRTGDRHAVAQTQCHFARALLGDNKTGQALDLLELALTTFRELDLPNEITEAERLIASIRMP